MSEDVKVQVHTLGEIILKLEMPKTFIDEINNVFDEKEKSSFLEVYKKYYFWNDVHFNAEGNRIIAERLIKEF